MICTFFGHRNTPNEIKAKLKETLIYLIEKKNVDLFYVGNNGNFDNLVLQTLNLLKHIYPHIQINIVLSYYPNKKVQFYNNTIYPEGLELSPPKFAISKRNHWMLDKADYVVTYVRTTFGGAYKFKELAVKKGKFIIDL